MLFLFYGIGSLLIAENNMNDFIHKREQEYNDFLSDKSYTDVLFNIATGALQATHLEHNFDRVKGYYEKHVQKIIYDNGNKIILESERKAPGIKTPDGTLNDIVFDIKSVEGTGKNNIKNKFNEAASQGCEHLVLFFPNADLYNQITIIQGYEKYRGVVKKEKKKDKLKYVWIIVNNEIIIYK